MSDIFISYAREDRIKAEQLARALNEQGWSVWWDLIIPVGKTFREVIQGELSKAKCVVVIWSENSTQSRFVLDEAEEGLARGVLVPVMFGDVKLPMGFRTLHTANLEGWDQNPAHPGYVHFLRAIQSQITKDRGKYKPAEPILPEPPQKHPHPKEGQTAKWWRSPMIYTPLIAVMAIFLFSLFSENSPVKISNFPLPWNTPSSNIIAEATATPSATSTPTQAPVTPIPSLTLHPEAIIPYWYPKEYWFPETISTYPSLKPQGINTVTNEKASYGSAERMAQFEAWGRIKSYERYYSHPDGCNSTDLKGIYVQIIFFDTQEGAAEFFTWAHTDADVAFTTAVGQSAYYYTEKNDPESDCNVDYFSISFQRLNAFARVRVRAIPSLMTNNEMQPIAESLAANIDQMLLDQILP